MTKVDYDENEVYTYSNVPFRTKTVAYNLGKALDKNHRTVWSSAMQNYFNVKLDVTPQELHYNRLITDYELFQRLDMHKERQLNRIKPK